MMRGIQMENVEKNTRSPYYVDSRWLSKPGITGGSVTTSQESIRGLKGIYIT